MDWNEYSAKLYQAMKDFKYNVGLERLLLESAEKGQTIFTAGNGGSASIAMHFTTDLSKGANPGWRDNTRRFRSICLSTNIGYLTALGNDEGYDQIFRQQLINLARPAQGGVPGDILILISSSGNSPNIVAAAEYAKQNGMPLIGLTGFKGGKLRELADYSGHVDTDSYEIAENVHEAFGQYLSQRLRLDLAKKH